MNNIIQKLNQYDWKKAIILALLLALIVSVGVLKGIPRVFDYIEQRDKQIFNDGYEVGRFDQLNEDANEQAIEKSNACFNLSKNKNLNMLLKKYFKDCNTARIMYAIAQAESSGKQFAVGVNDNGSLDGGWLQVNSIHRNAGETPIAFVTRMHDLEQNVALAKVVLDKQGFNAWVTYKNGKYKQYLK